MVGKSITLVAGVKWLTPSMACKSLVLDIFVSKEVTVVTEVKTKITKYYLFLTGKELLEIFCYKFTLKISKTLAAEVVKSWYRPRVHHVLTWHEHVKGGSISMTTKINKCIDTDLYQARNVLSELVDSFSVRDDDSLGSTNIELDGRHSAIMVPQQKYTLLCNQSHYSFKFSLMAPGTANISVLSGESKERLIELDANQAAFCFDVMPTTEVIFIRLVSTTSDMVSVTIEPCVEL